ncbi:MAG: response regulator [Desulfobulbaceae bacterium]|nr:response regulator [Desulfobulbaceae bacterium]
MTEPIKILCVDDEPNVLKALQRLFLDEDYELLTATDGQKGLDILQEAGPVQVVISDYRMPGMNGVEFLKHVYERQPETMRIALSGYADTAAVVEAINDGRIYKFIPKPWNDDQLKVTIAKAIEVYFLQRENELLTQELLASNEELKMVNANLEEIIKERTEEIMFQNKVLQHSQHILESLPVGVIGLDKNNMVIQCNNRACAIIAGVGHTNNDCGKFFGRPATAVLPGVLADLLEYITDAPRKQIVDLKGRSVTVRGVTIENDQGLSGRILLLDQDS